MIGSRAARHSGSRRVRKSWDAFLWIWEQSLDVESGDEVEESSCERDDISSDHSLKRSLSPERGKEFIEKKTLQESRCATCTVRYGS